MVFGAGSSGESSIPVQSSFRNEQPFDNSSTRTRIGIGAFRRKEMRDLMNARRRPPPQRDQRPGRALRRALGADLEDLPGLHDRAAQADDVLGLWTGPRSEKQEDGSVLEYTWTLGIDREGQGFRATSRSELTVP